MNSIVTHSESKLYSFCTQCSKGLNETLTCWSVMWWLHRKPEVLESDLRAKIGQNGISSGVGRQDLKLLLCYLSEGRNLLLNTRNNSGGGGGGTRHRSVQVPRPYGTVQNGRETFPEWPTRGLARKSVASPSQISRMSLEDSYVTRHGRKSVASHS